MFYVGLDIHAKTISICVLNEHGKVDRRAKLRSVTEMITFLKQLSQPLHIVYEASCGYGAYHDLLRPLAQRVLVANPSRLRLIFRSRDKSDRKDAERLAKLLYLGEVPTVHVPSQHVRTWRELVTHRCRLIQQRTSTKNKIRALLRSLLITAPRSPGLWTRKGIEWLRELEFACHSHALKRDMLLHDLSSISDQIARFEKELKTYSDPSPEVFQLMSIPGVGIRTAEAMVAFLDDPGRFPNAKALGRYFGLVPSQDQSAGRNHLGRITKEGSAIVRQLMVEAAWQSVRRSPLVEAYFERLRRSDPKRRKIALVGTAHYLVRVMFAMLRDGTLWREPGNPSTAPSRAA